MFLNNDNSMSKLDINYSDVYELKPNLARLGGEWKGRKNEINRCP